MPNILFVDIIDLKKTWLISVWDNIYAKGIYNIGLSKNDHYVFVAITDIGLIILDIKDVTKPIFLS